MNILVHKDMQSVKFVCENKGEATVVCSMMLSRPTIDYILVPDDYDKDYGVAIVFKTDLRMDETNGATDNE